MIYCFEMKCMKIDLKTIVDAFESISDSFDQYLNVKTGEIIFLPGIRYMGSMEDFEDDIEKVDSSDDYIRLPDQSELREYNIMEEFINSISLKSIKINLLNCIHKKHVFRNFKIEANKLGIINDYYEFRRKCLERKAIDWCNIKKIEYVESND